MRGDRQQRAGQLEPDLGGLAGGGRDGAARRRTRQLGEGEQQGVACASQVGAHAALVPAGSEDAVEGEQGADLGPHGLAQLAEQVAQL